MLERELHLLEHNQLNFTDFTLHFFQGSDWELMSCQSVIWCHIITSAKKILALLRKFWDPQQISQPGDLAKGLWTLREFERQWDLTTEHPQDWGNKLLDGTNKILCTPGPRRKEQWPHKRWSQSCLWVSRSLWWKHGSTVTCCRVRGTDFNSPGSHMVLA